MDCINAVVFAQDRIGTISEIESMRFDFSNKEKGEYDFYTFYSDSMPTGIVPGVDWNDEIGRPVSRGAIHHSSIMGYGWDRDEILESLANLKRSLEKQRIPNGRPS